jgi:hypothetical protein
MLQLSKRNLIFDINAISEFDDISKINFFELVQTITDSSVKGQTIKDSKDSPVKGQRIPITVSQIRSLVYAGMLHKDDHMTIKQAGMIVEEYLKDHDLADLMGIIAEAIMESSLFSGGTNSKNDQKGE